MLARRLATILPEMSLAEAIETTRIHRVAGLTGARTAVVATRPCRAPHHPISDVGLIGGGQVPMPGEVSLAHHGDSLSGCTAGVPPPRARGAAPTPRGWGSDDRSRLSV